MMKEGDEEEFPTATTEVAKDEDPLMYTTCMFGWRKISKSLAQNNIDLGSRASLSLFLSLGVPNAGSVRDWI